MEYLSTLLAAVLFAFWWWRQVVRRDVFGTADRLDVRNIRLEIKLHRAGELCPMCQPPPPAGCTTDDWQCMAPDCPCWRGSP